MDSISALTYYIKLFWAYGTYYMLYIVDVFHDYPVEVKIAAIATALWSVAILTLSFEMLRQSLRKRRKRKTQESLRSRFLKGLEYMFVSDEASPNMTREEIMKVLNIDTGIASKNNLLRNKLEKQVFCRMIYDILISDYARSGRRNNLYQTLDIFGIPKFLEDDVNYGSLWNKVSAINMIRTYRLPISPWVINKLMDAKRIRIRRLAMYSAVRSSSENDLGAFETEFFENNCCIYDEIVIGYELQRRKKDGVRLPNLARWSRHFKSPEIRCMFIRMMRRFEQKEACGQLMDIFVETRHKKLVEEICRTWGYLRYIDSEDIMVESFPLQPDDTKVAILHAIARINSGRRIDLFTYAYETSLNPHVRFEALRCLYNYGVQGRAKLKDLENNATPVDKKFFDFFHNAITLQNIPLDEVQIYHQTIETYYSMAN